jgi:DNA/RNA-binding domain of Phe-tRNA-synthetase-like protein
MLLSASTRWKATYPGSVVGVLAMRRVANPENSPSLDARKEDLETRIRGQYPTPTRSALKSHPSLRPYAEYYKRFGKTYHVQLQLESIVLKGRSIPRVAALVEAMFMAELSNLILTAGHDLDSVHGQVSVDVAAGGESYVTLSGQTQAIKQSDMFICDDEGTLSCVIYGPAHRARITPATTRVLFTTYAPPGIGVEKVHDHLSDLKANVLTITPDAEVEDLETIVAR